MGAPGSQAFTALESPSELILGLRCLALSVVAGSAVFLPVSSSLLGAGVIASLALALLQVVAVRHGASRLAAFLIPAQVGTWTTFVHAAGGHGSSLFVGYLLELPQAAVLSPRHGTWLAAGSAVAAYMAYAAILDPPIQLASAATVCGFIAVGAVMTHFVVGVLTRQRKEIESSRIALAQRAHSLTEELRLLADYLAGALIGIDERGCVASINPAGMALLARADANPLGAPWQEALRLDAESRRYVAETLSEGSPLRGATLALETGEGRRVRVLAEMWLSPTPGGRRAYLLLDPISQGPNPDDPVRRLGEAASCVAHQIRNSIHVLQGYVHAVGHGDPQCERERQTKQRYLGALRSLGALADDVLTMADVPTRCTESVPLEEVVRFAMMMVPQGDGRVRVHRPADTIQVRANRSQLLHALFNLLDNALRVTPATTAVEVSIWRSPGWVIVEILDSGPGLPEHVARSNGRVPSRVGSGLGLMASRRFVESSGGRISFSPAEGGGTSVRLELPEAAPEPATADARG